MKSLAEALVEAVAFLELSDDEVVEPDSAVKAMESIGYSLKSASKEEKGALLDYCRDQAAKLAGARSEHDKKRRKFYEEFEEGMGLNDL